MFFLFLRIFQSTLNLVDKNCLQMRKLCLPACFTREYMYYKCIRVNKKQIADCDIKHKKLLYQTKYTYRSILLSILKELELNSCALIIMSNSPKGAVVW
jgi:hypothetical protein